MSRDLPVAVSSALGRFTAVCGMGTGGTAPLRPPEPWVPSHSEDVEDLNFADERVDEHVPLVKNIIGKKKALGR